MRTEGYRSGPPSRKGAFWLLSLGATLAAGLGVVTNAGAIEDPQGELGFSTSFTEWRDPVGFMQDLDVVLPRPAVPLNRADAVAQVLFRRSRTLGDLDVRRVATVVVEEARRADLDPLLVVALIRIESNYNHLALSPVGAEGLMQLMPPTAQWMADRSDLSWPQAHSFDPGLNVRLGTRYLAHLLAEFDGNLDHALTAYNRGPSATRAILRRHGELPMAIKDFYSSKIMRFYEQLWWTYRDLPVT